MKIPDICRQFTETEGVSVRHHKKKRILFSNNGWVFIKYDLYLSNTINQSEVEYKFFN
jgi:hypothetical protein